MCWHAIWDCRFMTFLSWKLFLCCVRCSVHSDSSRTGCIGSASTTWNIVYGYKRCGGWLVGIMLRYSRSFVLSAAHLVLLCKDYGMNMNSFDIPRVLLLPIFCVLFRCHFKLAVQQRSYVVLAVTGFFILYETWFLAGGNDPFLGLWPWKVDWGATVLGYCFPSQRGSGSESMKSAFQDRRG